MMNRTEIADLIVARLNPEVERLGREFGTAGRIAACQAKNILPTDLVEQVYRAFPASERMILKRSIKENKHVVAQMDEHDPLLEEIVYAFQDPRVVDLVGHITGLATLEPDADLYAGGISAMSKGAYLRPHLDNSHDKDRKRYRALNLLFYVTPGWREDFGGSLQLWDNGPRGKPRTIPSLFNSLVIMLTDDQSWHSVNEVRHDGRRCCVSNYYFSRAAPGATNYSHATTFRAEHGRGLADFAMRADNALRTTILNSTGGALWHNPHVYQRDKH
ncbi:MAG TPA: 2OG-Fe(II) oxygenase [Sphingopyxis sp.]|jgi:Rps23 Pro-64 3,4-dihydroxylase Tpa1-like proline 4-hydroxylase|nr:2OG-Fe(II) oxygenase [Sphingopyxis sp.]